MKNFEEIKVLGDGGFGTVLKCKDKDTGQIVAIKKMKQKFSSFEECLQLKEIKSLKKIKHENVVRLLQVFRENESLYLVFECLGENLYKTMSNRNGIPFEENEIRYMLSEMLNGLAIIHRQGFFHRDMKPDNLLWSEDGRLKICDFGLAREIRSKPPYTEYVGTRWYRAPEIILRHPFYNSPVDIWSLGCIACELFMLKPIFQGTSETDQLYKIMSILGTPTASSWPDFPHLAQKRGIRTLQTGGADLRTLMPNASPEAIDFIKQCLQYNPANRPSATRLLQHPFMQGTKTAPSLQPVKLSTAKTVPVNIFADNNTYQQPQIQQQQLQYHHYNQQYQMQKTVPVSILGDNKSPQKSQRYHQQTPMYQNYQPHYQQSSNYKNPMMTQNRKIYKDIFHSPRAKPFFPMKTQFV